MLDTRVEDLIESYVDHYSVSEEEAVKMMKDDLDAALKERSGEADSDE